MKKPNKVIPIVTIHIQNACEQYIEFLSSDDYHEDKISDYENVIFEMAMESVYGQDVWDYVNDKIQ